ncbi:MAG: hypothetical protein AAF747_00835 [Planctomycetota bacterium]
MRHGFTLAETVLSLFIMSAVVSGLISALMIVAEALPNPDPPRMRAMRTAEIIASDFAEATAVEFFNATQVQLTLPDRGWGDVGPERVMYNWSGTPGSDIERIVNGGPRTPLCSDVRSVQFKPTLGFAVYRVSPKVLVIFDHAEPQEAAAIAAALRRAGVWSQAVASDEFSSIESAAAASDAALLIGDIAADVSGFLSVLPPSLGLVLGGDSAGKELELDSSDILIKFSSGTVVAHQAPTLLDGLDLGYIAAEGTAGPQSEADEVTAIIDAILNGTYDNSGGGDDAYAAFGLVDIGGTLNLGQKTTRRIALAPWGEHAFDPAGISHDDSIAALSRIVAWAGARRIYREMTVAITCGPDSSGSVQLRTRMHNEPLERSQLIVAGGAR